MAQRDRCSYPGDSAGPLDVREGDQHATPNFSRPLNRHENQHHIRQRSLPDYHLARPMQRGSQETSRPVPIIPEIQVRNVHEEPDRRQQSITFAPISYALEEEQREWRKKDSLAQGPDAIPAEPTLYGTRHGYRPRHERRRTGSLQPSSWTLQSLRTRSSLTAKRRRSISAPYKNRPQSLSCDSEHNVVDIKNADSLDCTSNDVESRVAGVDQRDFAFLQKDATCPPRLPDTGYRDDHFPRTRTQRPESWTPRSHDGQRRSSRLSDHGNFSRRASHSIETIFGSDRKPSIVARMTEGVLGPTAEELATKYSVPSIAAFSLDLEKGPTEPDRPVNPARSLTRRELLCQRMFFASLVLGFNAACIFAVASGNTGAWYVFRRSATPFILMRSAGYLLLSYFSKARIFCLSGSRYPAAYTSGQSEYGGQSRRPTKLPGF